MPDSNIHIGDKCLKATGNIEVAAQGDRAVMSATGDDGMVLMQAGKFVMSQSGAAFMSIAGGEETGDITVQSSPTGTITIALGPILLGPCIKLSTEKIEITVGPPGVGASLTMTPLSIAVKLGVASMELTPASLAIAAAESKVSLTPASAARWLRQIAPSAAWSVSPPTAMRWAPIRPRAKRPSKARSA